MKKLILTAFIGLLALGMTSCKKDPTEKLIGSWTTHQEETLTIPGEDGEVLEVQVVLDALLNFQDAAAGKMSTDIAISYMGLEIGSENMEQPFTYTFDGTDGVINVAEVVIEDPQEGSTTTYEAQTLNFTLVDDTHISVSETDSETGEVTTIVFTKQ